MRHTLNSLGIPTSLLALLISIALPAQAAPKADLWPRWQAHQPDSSQQVDHQAWSDWLQTYLVQAPGEVTRVRYAAVSAADRKALQDYLDRLQETAVSQLNRQQQQAYWINLYNAATIDVVLQHYPVDSILDIDISPGLFARGPWGKKLLTVEGQAVSLNDIEHRILRPIWQDPRIHYAVNCASVGCPDLRTTAYTADDLDQQLDAAARAYVNHPRGVSIEDGDLIVSSIFDWFEADFGDSEAEVIRHLQRYADAPLKTQLQGFDDIDDDRYDWSLNDASR